MNRETFIFSAIFLFFGSSALLSSVTGDLNADKQALLDFLSNITHSPSLVWNSSSPVCATWAGITCNQDGSRVVAVHLPGARLLGFIPPDTLSRLSELQILSLRSNGLGGPFPSDFLRLKKLTGIYLQSNRFSGPLPSDFATWKNLTALDLSDNGFNGSIPAGFASLTGLISLNLAKNSFSGQIPDLNLPGLRYLNLSNNNLTGTVPRSLQRFGSSAFSGNNVIYENAPPPAIPSSRRRKQAVSLNKPAILGIAIGGCFMIFILTALLMIICYTNTQRRREGKKTNAKPQSKKEGIRNKSKIPDSTTEELEDNNSNDNNRVVFFEGSSLVFNLEDLLRASAEVLGKGTFGMTYKAVLEDSNVVAVKRLKELNISQKDFEQQMEMVGNIRHENIVPLRAYVCSKDEKLMVYEFHEKGSLSALLHGNYGGSNQNSPDWETRLRFVIGAARGVAHIHTHKLAHGNIKSSNIFLNINGYGCISETGLATLTNPIHPVISLARPQYRAPEVTDIRKYTPESDVYSFGVLILEILTGKSPATSDKEVDNLVKWVNSVLREQWTGEVFDLELVKIPDIEGKLLQMLELGLSCTVRASEKRPTMEKVVETLEEIERV